MPCLLKPRARLNDLTAGFRIVSLEPVLEKMWLTFNMLRRFSTRSFIDTITVKSIQQPMRSLISAFRKPLQKIILYSGSSIYCRLINPRKTYSVSELTELLIPIEKYHLIICSWKLTMLYQERLLISGFIHWIIHCLRSDSGAMGNCLMFKMSKTKTLQVCTFNS